MCHTGMRIGECVDVCCDCLRPVGPGQWGIHVPQGKLKTERWVPVDLIWFYDLSGIPEGHSQGTVARIDPAPPIEWWE